MRPGILRVLRAVASVEPTILTLAFLVALGAWRSL